MRVFKINLWSFKTSKTQPLRGRKLPLLFSQGSSVVKVLFIKIRLLPTREFGINARLKY